MKHAGLSAMRKLAEEKHTRMGGASGLMGVEGTGSGGIVCTNRGGWVGREGVRIT